MCLLLYGLPALSQAAPKRPAIVPPGAVEKITDHVYRIGTATVDTQARTVTCSGIINQDAGPIEYLAVAPGGKTHESLLRIDVRPLYLQIGLLMLDLEPRNVVRFQGDRTAPQGPPVEIRVRWTGGHGETLEARAEDWISEMPGNRPMPPHAWVFTGSRILHEGFEADMEKSLVAVWHDPAAILDNPLPGGGNNAYVVRSKQAPRRGVGVQIIFKAVPAAPPAPIARTGESRQGRSEPAH